MERERGFARLNKFFICCSKPREDKLAAFVFENGVVSAEELARAINNEMRSQDDKLVGYGDCLRVKERVVAVLHEKTVPESVIFVDKTDNLPFIEAAREVMFLKEFQ
jgi:hypothetical protein